VLQQLSRLSRIWAFRGPTHSIPHLHHQHSVQDTFSQNPPHRTWFSIHESSLVLLVHGSRWVSRLTLHWIGSFLNVGFSRPLMQDGELCCFGMQTAWLSEIRTDFWELPTPRHTNTMAENVEQNFYSRCPPERRSLQFRDSTPAAKDEKESVDEKDPHPEEGKYDESLFGALHTTFKRRIWLAGLLLLAAGESFLVCRFTSRFNFIAF